MTRKRETRSQHITVSMTSTDRARLEAWKATTGENASQLLTRLLKSYMDDDKTTLAQSEDFKNLVKTIKARLDA